MTRLGSILLWSVIAAAFIGPGTVTAAASAGSGFGLALLWAILFSGVATFTLQEFSARLAIASDSDLAAVLRARYPSGAGRALVIALVGGAVLLGCAAYEAGNILGSAAGAMLAVDLPRWLVTLLLGAAAGSLLFAGSPVRIAQVMGVLVALMGAGFFAVAVSLGPDPRELATGLVPDLAMIGDDTALLAVLALVGTTVVPYNLFLGSALARGQSFPAMRLGLGISVAVGTAITAAILVAGTALAEGFSFDSLADAAAGRLGEWARYGLAIGLLAAGLSSAVTAPLAAAFTARGLFGDAKVPGWQADGRNFRAVWAIVLVTGLGFGLADIRPAPAIVAAQAFNGALLPLVALFLLMAMNDRRVLGASANGAAANTIGLVVVAIAATLGLTAVARAGTAVFGYELSGTAPMLVGFAIAGLLLGVLALLAGRNGHTPPGVAGHAFLGDFASRTDEDPP